MVTSSYDRCFHEMQLVVICCYTCNKEHDTLTPAFVCIYDSNQDSFYIAMFNNNNNIAILRLQEEHKQWKYNHPKDFTAKPSHKLDGSLNYLYWECSIPGKDGT